MINQYLEIDNKLEKSELKVHEDPVILEHAWFDVIAPTSEEIEWLEKKLHVPLEFLKSAVDEEESSHIDTDDNAKLIIIDLPIYDHQKKNKFAYTTIPFGIIHCENHLITICTEETYLIKDLLSKNKKVEPHKMIRLTLLILYRLAMSYITFLKRIDAQTKEVEKELHTSLRNKELFDLMELNKSLVYFSNSLNANKVVVHKLTRSPEFKQFEADFDLLEDTEIEFNQAIDMCSVYRDILAGTMDAFASIISNNLNIVMKLLAVITIVLSIPTLVASFFGMNFINMPLGGSELGFYIVSGVSLLLSIAGAILLVKWTNRIK